MMTPRGSKTSPSPPPGTRYRTPKKEIDETAPTRAWKMFWTLGLARQVVLLPLLLGGWKTSARTLGSSTKLIRYFDVCDHAILTRRIYMIKI